MTGSKETPNLPNGVMFNAYPDSIGETLADTVALFQRPECDGAFSLFYILPTVFESDLDHGFSVIAYTLNNELVKVEDLKQLGELGIELKFDLVVNHLSVASPQFQDLLKHGDASRYREFFIDWNEFWEGKGEPDADGVTIPRAEYLNPLFMRKPGLPILQVRFPDGTDRPYWNTFYQHVEIVDGRREYLGQMDLNAQSEQVWAFYDETLRRLADYGARLIRLDAFAYLHKEPGQSNFFNRPGTWDYLDRLKSMATHYGLTLVPEIHSRHGDGLHREIAQEGYPFYDFFFPGLVIDALEYAENAPLLQWMGEVIENDIQTINMLGCHDGIPVLDLAADGVPGGGLLSNERIGRIIERVCSRGGRVKDLYGPDGKRISYYQVNATYFSALGENERKLLLARAIQIFMPGIPQVWYLDLFAGKNDYVAADAGGIGSHKEINRTRLPLTQVEADLQRSIVRDQIALLKLRNNSPAFQGTLTIIDTPANELRLRWSHAGHTAELQANLHNQCFSVLHLDAAGSETRITQD